MDKIKRFIDVFVPVTTCTLRCNYCYITHQRLFGGPLPVFKYTPETVRKALSKERLGGVCLFNICGDGETLLPPQIPDYVRALLEEGHYCMIVTNATVSKAFDKIAAFPPELLKRLFFKFSYHYLELKSKNLLDTFFENINKVRQAGASFTLEATPSDEWIPFIDEMQDVAIKNVGAVNHVTVARDEKKIGELPILTDMSREDYQKTWSVFNSSLFDFKLSIFEVKRKEFCYAGNWSFTLNLGTGQANQCYCGHVICKNMFEDVDAPIHWLPVGNNCKAKHCWNGHAWLALGDIPELKTPTYAEMRNRVCADGSEWLQPEMKSFMSTRLYESNREYTKSEKRKTNFINHTKDWFGLRVVASKIKRKIFK